MKKVIALLTLMATSGFSIANESSQYKEVTTNIQRQINQIKAFINNSSNDKIGTLDIKELNQSKAALAQLKAKPVKNKSNQIELNQLSSAIDTILNPNIALNSKSNNSLMASGTGIIRGIVRSEVTGETLTSYSVNLYDADGNYINSNQLDASGRYLFTNVPAGQYALIVNASSYNNFVYTAYPNVACSGGLGVGCQISDLTLVNLSDNEILENINISVLSVPVISGQLTDNVAGSVISYANLKLYDTLGNAVSTSNSDEFGYYQINAPSEGNYYLTVHHSDYQLQLYDGIICTNVCNFSTGNAIALSYSQHIENIDFSMQKNATISGNLVEAVTNLTQNYASIYVIDDSDQIVRSRNFQSSSYWSYLLPIGNYTIVAEKSNDTFLAVKYENNSCLSAQLSSCDYVSETLIQHTTVDTEDILLKMESGARISGVVLDSNNQPIDGAEILIYSATDNQLLEMPYTTRSDSNGIYLTNQLGNGDFYLIARKETHLTQLYTGTPCSISLGCDFNSGTVVKIENLTDVIDINFQLTPKSTISGTVVDSNNNPVSYTLVQVRDELSIDQQYSYTNQDGEYMIKNIIAGTYQLYVLGRNGDFSESYDNIICLQQYDCKGDAFTPLVLDNSQLIIDFQLSSQGKVTFDLVSNSPHSIFSGNIYVTDSIGAHVGIYDMSQEISLPEGDYYFYYQATFQPFNLYNFVPKVYGGSNCFDDCNTNSIMAGTLVHVSNNSQQTLPMNLDEYFYIDFTSTPSVNYFSFSLYEQNFTEHLQSGANFQNRVSISNLGNKYIKFSKAGFYDQIYNGINCLDLNCDLSQGDLIVTQLNSSITLNVDLNPIASISGVITDENNNPLPDRTVVLSSEINPTYNSMKQTTNANGEYSFDAVPLGNFYLRVENKDNYNSIDYTATTYYGNISCDENDCSSFSIPSISFNPNSYLVDYDIQMVTRGTLSGAGITDVFGEHHISTMKIYKVNGNNFDLIVTKTIQGGILLPIYLPKGEYKIIGNRQYQTVKTAFPATECSSNTGDTLCIEQADSLFLTDRNSTHFNSFIIHQYGIIKIVLRDAFSNKLIANGKLNLYKTGETTALQYSQSEEDDYFEISVLNSGDYRALLFDESGYPYRSYYRAQLYDGIDCLGGVQTGCNLDQGLEFSVEVDSVTSINANLVPLPELNVSLVDNVSNAAINSKLKIYDVNFDEVYSENNLYSNNTHYINYLIPGSYYAIAEPQYGNSYFATAYPNSVCDNWYSINTCDALIMPFELNATNGTAKELKIRANLQYGISGYVTDVTSGQPLKDIIIDFWNASGYHSSVTTSSSNGGFSSPLNPGDFYISTDTNNAYIDEVYQDIECQTPAILGQCDVTLGQLVNVPNNNEAPIIINIELEAPDMIYSNSFE